MKVKNNPDTKPSGKMGEAYRKQDKAPRKGVKADDADEYQSMGSDYDKSVKTHMAYRDQAKAPMGRGNRGPSQADGKSIGDYDMAVKPHGAYDGQCKWGKEATESPSLGFKRSKGMEYLGHFGNEENLRMGHNDGGTLSYGDSDAPQGSGIGYTEMGPDGVRRPRKNASPSPSPSPSPSDSRNMEQISTDFFNRMKK